MSLPFTHPFQESQFDIFEWYPKFQSCVHFFINNAQHTDPIRAVAASVNIKLPCQKSGQNTMSEGTLRSSRPPRGPSRAGGPATPSEAASDPSVVLLTPYVRRLVATAFDSPAILHGFFGDDWPEGIGPIHEAERRNYLFAAKSESWLTVKSHYDMDDGQTVPFLRPLQNVTLAEIEGAESRWSDWLAMQDWMLGPRSLNPEEAGLSRGIRQIGRN